MDRILKAKVIIELLDDRKYSVLSSFSSEELAKLNATNLEDLNNLSREEINGTISDFLDTIEKRRLAKIKPMEEVSFSPIQADPAPSTEKKAPLKPVKKQKKIAVSEKINDQPPQLLACILHRVDEDTKAAILSSIDEEKKMLINSIEVENTPISEQVIQVILNELEIKPNQP